MKEYSHPWLKFIYDWISCYWVEVILDDTESNYFWPSYYEFDVSTENYYWYKTVPNTDSWDTYRLCYSYNKFFDESAFLHCRTKGELKKEFFEFFKNSLVDSLFSVYWWNSSSDQYSFSSKFEDFENIEWYKECIDSAKEDIENDEMEELINRWNYYKIKDLKRNLNIFFKFELFTRISNKPIWALYYEAMYLWANKNFPFIDKSDECDIVQILQEKCGCLIREYCEFNEINNDIKLLEYAYKMKEWFENADEIIDEVITNLEKDTV